MDNNQTSQKNFLRVASLILILIGWVITVSNTQNKTRSLQSPIATSEDDFSKRSPIVTPTRDEIRHHYAITATQQTKANSTMTFIPILLIPLPPLSVDQTKSKLIYYDRDD